MDNRDATKEIIIPITTNQTKVFVFALVLFAALYVK